MDLIHLLLKYGQSQTRHQQSLGGDYSLLVFILIQQHEEPVLLDFVLC